MSIDKHIAACVEGHEPEYSAPSQTPSSNLRPMLGHTLGEGSMSIEDQIQMVAKRMREAESRSDYIEAEKERVLVEKLRRQLRSPNEDTFRQRWQLNLVEVEHDQATKVRHFDATWSARIAEHNEKEIVQMRALDARHQYQIRDLRDIEDSRTRFPKWSSGLLDLRKRQYLLGKTTRYVEAEKVRKLADRLERAERKILIAQIEKEVDSKIEALLLRQSRERKVCLDRLNIELQHMMEIRSQNKSRLEFKAKRAFQELIRQYRKTKFQRCRDCSPRLPASDSRIPHEDESEEDIIDQTIDEIISNFKSTKYVGNVEVKNNFLMHNRQ